MGNARILISPDARTVEETLRAHPAAVHVFSGISTYPMVYAAFKQAVRRGLKTMVYAEPYRRQGWRGLLRSVKYRFLRLRYGKKIAALLATGRLGVECYRRAGFPASRIYFHGNNKTDRDIRDALEMGVGTFVADNREELDALERLGADAGRVQSILLRITPGIDPHTHKAISTGRVDSKFGSAIETGQALDITRYALGLPHIALRGFHCHIGSQIFDRYPFVDAARIMIDFMASVRTATGFVAHELNLGGGLGVPYTEYDRTVDYAAVIRDMGDEMRAICRERDFPLPHVILEPGRSLVAAAGITLYTVGSVKTIPGFRTYVSVDGGMPDNPRYALYQSQYTALIANRPDAEQSWRVTLAGRCCESGDLIGENLPLQPTARGDILAVLTTGAYNYSMASNYNRLPRPALVMIRDGKPFVAVRRETYEDVVRNDVF